MKISINMFIISFKENTTHFLHIHVYMKKGLLQIGKII
jgi:hypothetical protein